LSAYRHYFCQSLYERFKTLSWQQQIGNIASTLANISRYVDSLSYDELTKLSLREAALAIDWCVPNVPQKFLLDMAMMHRELLAWWQVSCGAAIAFSFAYSSSVGSFIGDGGIDGCGLRSTIY
jgi:hypothetical protein